MNVNNIINQYAAHTGNVNGLHYKLIGNNVADVFSGDGFGVPTRLRKVRGQWAHISGPKLLAAEQLAVVTALA